MRMFSRRQVVLGLSAAPFLAAACELKPSGPPPPDERLPLPPWQAPGSVDEVAFAWGLWVGDARADGGLVSVKTTEPTVTLVVMAEGDEDWVEALRVENLEVVDETARFSLSGLSPDARYSLVAYAADGERRTSVTALRTALAPGQSRVIRFGATSCLGGNAPWSSMSHVAAMDLDFFCLLGDTVYADGYAIGDFPGLYKSALSTQGLRDVSAAASIVATWDDHEVQNNWTYAEAGVAERVDAAAAAFHNAIPVENGLGERGIYRALRWGDALELFVLDSRGERRDGNYLSPEQMAWLKASLAASTARFKVILNSVPMTDLADMVGDVEANDRWQGYPVQRSEILSFIAEQQIGGILWLSGDFHLGALGKVDVAGGPAAEQYEVLCGPSGSPINPYINLIDPTERVPHILGQHNCVFFEADPAAGTVLVRFIDDAGAILVEELLTVT